MIFDLSKTIGKDQRALIMLCGENELLGRGLSPSLSTSLVTIEVTLKSFHVLNIGFAHI